MRPFDGYHDQKDIPRLVAVILNGSPEAKFPKHTGTWCLEDPKEIKRRGEAMQVAKQHLRSTLRQLVDQWIDSGRGFVPENADLAKERSLFKRPQHAFALEKFISGWLARNPPKIGLLSGNLGVPGGIPEQPPIFFQINPPGLDEHLPAQPGGMAWGVELAGYWLLRLISCPIQKRFARCSNDGCRKYFVYERALKQRYETYCPNCKGKGAALRVASANERKHERRIKAAARFWSRWKPSYGNRSSWVAAMAAKESHLREGDTFGRRFITTFASEIEESSKGGNNAARKN
jgi:ribosomal protein L44E